VKPVSEIKTLSIDLVKIDGDTQGRAEINTDHVTDLKHAWESKVDLPPLIVFFDGNEYWLGDGFHRWHGAKAAKRGSVPCDVRKGTVRDAQLYALTEANRTHGLKLSHADKRAIVKRMLADKEWGQKTTQWIASEVGFSRAFVEELRKPQPNKAQGVTLHPEKRVGKDGKVYSKTSPKKLPSQSDEPPTPAEDETPQNGQIDESPVKQADEPDESPAVGKLFSAILEHLRQSTLLLDRINKVVPNAKLRGEIFDSLELANTDIIKWRNSAKTRR
jgi:ParB-like chromosome segregation protein Spo0J